MAFMTIIAVVEIAEESTSPDPDERLEVAQDLFRNPDKVRFISAEQDVTATAVLAGADPALWPEGTVKGEF